MDIATGMALDFPHDRFDNSTISKAANWMTGGYENGDQVSFLGIVRYPYQPNKIFADDPGKLNSKNIFDTGRWRNGSPSMHFRTHL